MRHTFLAWQQQAAGGEAVPEYLTITEVAQLLRLGERTVYEMMRKGRIPGAAKVGGNCRAPDIASEILGQRGWLEDHPEVGAWVTNGTFGEDRT